MNKKIKNATPLEYEGIKFKSKLEVMVYKTLKENNFDVFYEPHTFNLWYGFKPRIPFYTPKNKVLINNDKKIIDIKYTPDFTFRYKDIDIYIEAKGMKNDTYYLKNKLFRGFLEEKYALSGEFSMYFEIYTKKQLLQAIQIIKDYDSSRNNETNV
jgi:hypothetical protein